MFWKGQNRNGFAMQILERLYGVKKRRKRIRSIRRKRSDSYPPYIYIIGSTKNTYKIFEDTTYRMVFLSDLEIIYQKATIELYSMFI